MPGEISFGPRAVSLGMALGVLLGVGASADWWRYPPQGEIASALTDGDPLAIRVDKSHRLAGDYIPAGLLPIPAGAIRTRGEIRIRKELLEPLRELGAAAKRDGIDLCVVSGYRSFARQAELYTASLRSEGGHAAAADKYSARAGHSEHQLGTAVDFSTGEINDEIGPRFHRTEAARWLEEHAGQFGFRMSYPKGKERETGYRHEGWHWRYWGDAEPTK